MTLSAVQLAEKQLAAYNSHDLDLFCSCFSDDVEVELLIDGEVLFRGMAAFRKAYADRFSHPNLHAKLLNRIAVGRVVIDEEEVTGLGDGVLHVLAIYEVVQGLINKVRFERATNK
ncbi:nuclear transport factor 2 family protein [uncultured Kiloniella sp.]|uniref:nuclear transport factor 2 family protein n=1 Tax=uncultured Kiloniella sp. TaxID=1133091 RepID=UPI00261D3920|nr:nuclear transport factor 2 family protein [uncultured Kiloniella sp.]